MVSPKVGNHRRGTRKERREEWIMGDKKIDACRVHAFEGLGNQKTNQA
jgi:hypothetical protein